MPNFNRLAVYSYNPGSQGARLLADSLRCVRIRHEASRFKGNLRTLLINWGARSLPYEATKCTVLNNPKAVAKAADKISFFKTLTTAVPIPKWTDDPAIAKVWYDDGKMVVGRKLVNSSEGRGIVLMKKQGGNRNYRDHVSRDFVPNLPLYTVYISKVAEYRVHVIKGKVVLIAQKRKREGEQHSYVRNSVGGWVFSINNVDPPPPGMTDACIKCIKELGLDFGALDVVVTNDSKFFILEVNTAPGIEGTTVEKYKEAFSAI